MEKHTLDRVHCCCCLHSMDLKTRDQPELKNGASLRLCGEDIYFSKSRHIMTASPKPENGKMVLPQGLLKIRTISKLRYRGILIYRWILCNWVVERVGGVGGASKKV